MSTDSQLDRAARILDLLAEAAAPLRYRDIQIGLDDLNAASLNRLLNAMTELGILHHDNASYWPTARCAQWANAAGCKASLAERADPLLKQLHHDFSMTTILLEQQGKRIVPVAKYAHEHAPTLMAAHGRFPPRLPYFSCIFWSQPDKNDLESWVTSQMVDIHPDTAQRIKEGITVTKRYLKHGYYLDREIYPGQTRIGVGIFNRERCIAVIGAACLTATCNKQREQDILAALQAAARSLELN